MVGKDIWKSASQTGLSPCSVMCLEHSYHCECRIGLVAVFIHSALTE